MFNRPIKPSCVAALLALGLAAAHAQEAPAAAGGASPLPGHLDLTLHQPPPARLALPGATPGIEAPSDLHETEAGHQQGVHAHRLAPHLALLTGFDPYDAFDALDFKPRAGGYAVGLQLNF